MDQLHDNVAEFATGEYVVRRKSASRYNEQGRLVADGAESTFTAVMSVQPISGRTLETVPASDRTSEMRTVYCAVELKTRTSTTEADVVIINDVPGEYHVATEDGEDWTVISSTRWKFDGEWWVAVIGRDAQT